VLDETRIRLEAIHHVRDLRERWVAVPSSELQHFTTGGRRIFLKGQQGIFKPAELSDPLSITSTIDSPYTNNPIEGSRVLYDFLPTSREYQNLGLKRCAESELPLIYFLQVKRKPNPEYVIFAPVFVVGWDDASRRFLLDLSEQKPGEVASPPLLSRQLMLPEIRTPESPMEIRELSRSYVVTSVQRRLHHARFRNAVLRAYRDRCAVCGLRMRPLLDAAYVLPDRDPQPLISVSDGLALCATHHRAFDAHILGYDEEYCVRIKLPERFTIGEGERAMLLAFEGKKLELPADQEMWPLSSAGFPAGGIAGS
jgi:putative restriction endonuclease